MSNISSSNTTIKAAIKNVIQTGEGTSNYNALTNLPSINGKVLKGDTSLTELGITDEVDNYISEHKEELKGDPGKDGIQGPPGKDGVNGADGAPGKDGKDGIQGPPGKDGKDGEKGADGAPGTNGKDGAPGADGRDGTDGDSAYTIAVAHGFVGTESEWLASLKGADGHDGVDGKDGLPGTPGRDGVDGKDGNSGVYVGTTEPTDPDVNVWINPDGEPTEIIGTFDVLANKKIAFVGDSITYGTGSTVATTPCDGYYNPYSPKQSYPEIIKSLHPSALVYNYAQAGLPIGVNTSGSNLIAILNSLISAVENVDLLILSGGVNDAWVGGTTLGALSDDFSGSYDTSTFYGALEQYIYNAINAYPNAYIMFLMTHNNIYKNYGNGNVDMNNVIREVCAKWKITLIDLNKNIGINLSIPKYKSMYMADDTHPNEQCYRKFYAPICINELERFGADSSASQTPTTPEEPSEPEQPDEDTWDGEAYISAAWQSYTTTEKYTQPNAKCIFSGTLLSDKTITNLEIKLVSGIISVNLTANVPYELDVEFTPTMSYTGNLVFTAKGSGYPANIKYKNLKFTKI